MRINRRLFRQLRRLPLVSPRLWLRRIAFWAGAVMVALMAIAFAWLADEAQATFRWMTGPRPWLVLILVFGILVALNVFGRRAQRSALTEMEGQPGAGISVVQRMRGDWRVTTPVAVNRNQDLVSRVVSRAGVVVIAEGRGRGARDLLAAEMRRVRKVAGDAPVIDIIVMASWRAVRCHSAC